MDMIAIGRVVLTSRDNIIGLEPLDKGLKGMLLRYPYEVRNEHEYLDDIQDVKVTKECSISPGTSSTRRQSTLSRRSLRTITKRQ
jgi:non-homologous end joining protein Ku